MVDFFVSILNNAPKVLFFCEIFSNFVMRSGILCHEADILESVFASFVGNLTVSLLTKGVRATPISCICAIGVPTPIVSAYYRCGAL